MHAEDVDQRHRDHGKGVQRIDPQDPREPEFAGRGERARAQDRHEERSRQQEAAEHEEHRDGEPAQIVEQWNEQVDTVNAQLRYDLDVRVEQDDQQDREGAQAIAESVMFAQRFVELEILRQPPHGWA